MVNNGIGSRRKRRKNRQLMRKMRPETSTETRKESSTETRQESSTETRQESSTETTRQESSTETRQEPSTETRREPSAETRQEPSAETRQEPSAETISKTKELYFFDAIEITRIETESRVVLEKDPCARSKRLKHQTDFYFPIEITSHETEHTITLCLQTPTEIPKEKKEEELKQEESDDDDDDDEKVFKVLNVAKAPREKNDEPLIVATCPLEKCKQIAKQYFDPTMLDAPLPDGVENIDAYDDDDAQCCSEYVGFIMERMRKNQVKTMALKRASSCSLSHAPSTGKLHVTEKQRAILVDWIIDVVVKFKLLSESYFTCVELLDRCLQLDQVLCSLKELQLIGICCLMIATKAEEMFYPEVRDFIYICDRAFTREQIVKGEQTILIAVRFEVYPATSLFFLRRFSKAARSSAETHTMSKYICENACIDYTICQSYLPSEIAIGAVVAAHVTYETGTLFTPTMQHYSQHSKPRALQVAIDLMHHLEKSWSPTYTLKAAKRKYSSEKLLEVGKKEVKHVLPRLRAEFKMCE